MGSIGKAIGGIGQAIGSGISGIFGGGGAAPTSQRVDNTNIPEYARPYVENMLGATQQQLFNIGPNGEVLGVKPYTPFSTDPSKYVAGFSPMQEQAFKTAASPEAFGQAVQGYMSPYMQNVVDIQKREAGRQAGIMGLQQQAQATQYGAFGGYRQGIQEAERQRNLSQQMNDIQAQGSQAAYLQGAQQANLAQQQQMQYGSMQQALEQQKINQQIQDFSNAQQYPQQQLAFMNAQLRGLPLSQSTQTQYQAPPSALSQMAGLGLSAYGLSRLAGKKGGLPKDFEKKKDDAPGGLQALALSKM
jgi:hypothetical protein